LIGPYRSGKTYPAIHEALFICKDNPGHEFGVFRNTEPSLAANIQKDFLAVAENAGAVKKWEKSKADLTLWNGCVVRFRALRISRAQLKGMNMCGWLIDDPDVGRYKEVISFLYSRLTDPPGVSAKYFTTIICANYEGHDWLWQQYMRRKDPGGNGMFAYWFCVTKDNPTLSPDYIEIQKSVHSEAWMKRYIYGDVEGYVGLVFDEYDPKFHDADLSWCVKDHSLIKILGNDLGITHPTVTLKAATDGKNVYFYDEWYKTGIRTSDLGYKLTDTLETEESFRDILIDPKSCAKEQTSGKSPRGILKNDFGIRTKIANNNVRYGIEIMKSLLTIREDDQGKKAPRFFVDPVRCPKLVKELETLKWKEPQTSDFDELAYTEEPMDIDNDCTDTARYCCVHLKKYIRGLGVRDRSVHERKMRRLENRLKLDIYRDHPNVGALRTKALRDLNAQRQAGLDQLTKPTEAAVIQ
jgi:hypothetical protein